MAKQKLSTSSVMSKNMANLCYMKLHKRMYLVWHPEKGGLPYLHLVLADDFDSVISVTLTEDAATSFLQYEMSFDTMLLLFSHLCIQYGQIKLSF